MGYSVRTERWRCTFWRKRNAAEITYTELYDEQSDPHETQNLAELPEHAELILNLKNHLPETGSDAAPAVKAKPTKPSNATTSEPRDQRFDRLYPGKAKLSLQDYLAGQSGDVATSTERFAKMDQDKDGILTRKEFISSGYTQKK